MKKITQEEFDLLSIPFNFNKVIQCPADTDYSDIKFPSCTLSVGNNSAFGNGCIFSNPIIVGNNVTFGQDCQFYKYSSFGNECIFGKKASFGNFSNFGQETYFGEYTKFGSGCLFGHKTNFEVYTKFGYECSFGTNTSFSNNTQFEESLAISMPGNPLIQFDRFGSALRFTQFFNTKNGIWVRCGCQLLIISAFRKRIQTHCKDLTHAVMYKAMADMASAYFEQENHRSHF
jgi:hypothetical protein